MIRIVIEIDGREVSSTVVQPTGISGALPRELLARATALGALDAGSAPIGLAASETAGVAPVPIDAGPSREHGGSSERAD
jgi:hypothetical protein